MLTMHKKKKIVHDRRKDAFKHHRYRPGNEPPTTPKKGVASNKANFVVKTPVIVFNSGAKSLPRDIPVVTRSAPPTPSGNAFPAISTPKRVSTPSPSSPLSRCFASSKCFESPKPASLPLPPSSWIEENEHESVPLLGAVLDAWSLRAKHDDVGAFSDDEEDLSYLLKIILKVQA